jgi:hypothetical protein
MEGGLEVEKVKLQLGVSFVVGAGPRKSTVVVLDEEPQYRYWHGRETFIMRDRKELFKRDIDVCVALCWWGGSGVVITRKVCSVYKGGKGSSSGAGNGTRDTARRLCTHIWRGSLKNSNRKTRMGVKRN